MKELIEAVKKLKKSDVKKLVDSRIKEFKEFDKKSNIEIFSELCFCIMTANFNAERSIKIQNDIGDGFSYLPEAQLAKKLKILGHRFPLMRAKYIINARRYKDSLKQIIKKFEDERSLRTWLVKNIKGIGMKEASHFLRNVGFENVAIIDFHIVDVLAKYEVIERPKTLTTKKYLEIEDILKKLAKKTGLTLAELDLYLWYMETGKVLK